MFLKLREKLFGTKASNSVAKSRLHFVLVQDRTGLTNEELAEFKAEMIGVIERYFVIDKQGFDISYRRSNETTTLYINSPIIVRRQEAVKGDVGARHKEKDKEKEKSSKKNKDRAAEPIVDTPQVAGAD